LKSRPLEKQTAGGAAAGGLPEGDFALLLDVSLHLLAGLQALRTDVHALLDAIRGDSHALKVRVEAPLGMPHGVTDVVSELRPLAANFTPGH
jgi:hypothetical protein